MMKARGERLRLQKKANLSTIQRYCTILSTACDLQNKTFIMKKHTLSATTRTLVGRKVKNLRKQGQIPATVYGKGITSASLAMATDAFAKVYKETGETGLIELQLEKDVRPVLVHT